MSSGIKYEVTLIEKEKHKEVVAVRTAEVIKEIEIINSHTVNTQGNVIKETNNITYIQSDQHIQTSIQSIIQKKPELAAYQV